MADRLSCITDDYFDDEYRKYIISHALEDMMDDEVIEMKFVRQTNGGATEQTHMARVPVWVIRDALARHIRSGGTY